MTDLNLVTDKPRATFCGHWVHAVWVYAGVNPTGDTPAFSPDVKAHTTGITGEISFGAGKRFGSDGKGAKQGILNEKLKLWADHKGVWDKYNAECAKYRYQE